MMEVSPPPAGKQGSPPPPPSPPGSSDVALMCSPCADTKCVTCKNYLDQKRIDQCKALKAAIQCLECNRGEAAFLRDMKAQGNIEEVKKMKVTDADKHLAEPIKFLNV
jgi:hypothetical protein